MILCSLSLQAVHLDLCPWTYPRDGPRRYSQTTQSNKTGPAADADTNADLLRYQRESDFRAEFGLVKEENGPHHQVSYEISETHKGRAPYQTPFI